MNGLTFDGEASFACEVEPKPRTIYQQIAEASEPLLEAYKGDLAWDETWMERNPGVPFFHLTRKYGTHCVGMPPVETFPAEGVLVKILFHQGNRWDLLKTGKDVLEYFVENPEVVLVQYYDGHTITTLPDVKSALEIYQKYFQRIETLWKAEQKNRR